MSGNVRYRNAHGRMIAHYPASFHAGDLRELEEFLSSRPTRTLREVAAGLREDGTVALRRDVDHNLEHAVAFAEREAKLGVSASYFVLPEAWYWDGQNAHALVGELLRLGHEVGLHSNVCALAYREGERPNSGKDEAYQRFYERAAEILAEQLAALRAIVESYGVEVVGTAAHGDRLYYDAGIDNNAIWGAGYRLEEFGLEYEAYQLHARGGRYVIDNRGVFSGPLDVPGDDRQVHLVLHPEHWEVP